MLADRSGFLVPQRDEEALAEKLSYLIEHPDVRSEMGQAGRRHVEECFDLGKLNEHWVTVYEQLRSARVSCTGSAGFLWGLKSCQVCPVLRSVTVMRNSTSVVAP